MITEERIKLNVAENLARFMAESDLTQMQLAEAAQVSQSFISKLLRQKSVCSSLDLKNLADALEVKTDDLVCDPTQQMLASA